MSDPQRHIIEKLERELKSYEGVICHNAGEEREREDRVSALRRELERAKAGKLRAQD